MILETPKNEPRNTIFVNLETPFCDTRNHDTRTHSMILEINDTRNHDTRTHSMILEINDTRIPSR